MFLFGYLLWMNWKLTLVMVAILPVIGVHGQRAPARNSASRARRSRWPWATSPMSPRKPSRATGWCAASAARPTSARASSRRSRGQQAQGLQHDHDQAIYTPSLQLVIYTGMAVLMYMVLFCAATPPRVTWSPTSPLAGLLPKPIRQLSEVSSTIQKGVAGAESVSSSWTRRRRSITALRARARQRPPGGARPRASSYPDTEKPVLHDISFVVEPGQMVALVGRSGSGKSTLASLIPRFYHHEQGQILTRWSGCRGIHAAQPASAHRPGHPACHPVQRQRDQRHSLRRPRRRADRAGRQAAEAAYAGRVHRQAAAGLRHPGQQNGVLLSGGQRQRLAIARALLRTRRC